MNTDDFRFSASSFKTYLQCGQKFKYEKIDKLKVEAEDEVGHSRWMGKLVHASVYSSIANFIPSGGFKSWGLTGRKPDVQRALSVFRALWVQDYTDPYIKELYDAEVSAPRPTGKFKQKKKVASLKTEDQTELEANWKIEAEKMVIKGVESLSRASSFVEMEKHIEFQYEGKRFSGYVDLLCTNSKGQIAFIDLKTVWDKPNEAKLQVDPQFILYSHALKVLLGLDYYPRGYFAHMRSGTLVEFEMSPQVLADFDKQFSSAISMLEKGLFYKSPSALCGYCDFYKNCFGG